MVIYGVNTLFVMLFSLLVLDYIASFEQWSRSSAIKYRIGACATENGDHLYVTEQ